MKILLITISFLPTYGLFSQLKSEPISDSIKKIQINPKYVRGIDISKASPNEQGLILYMETLSDKEALEFLKSFVVGEIVYKETEKIELIKD